MIRKEGESEDVTASTMTEHSQLEEDKQAYDTVEDVQDDSDESFGSFTESEVLMCDEYKRPLEPLSISAHWERDVKSLAKEFLELKETRGDLVVDSLELRLPEAPAPSSAAVTFKAYLKKGKELQDHKAFKQRSGFLDPTDNVCQVLPSPDLLYRVPRLAWLKPQESKVSKVETEDVGEFITQQCQNFLTRVWPQLKFRTIYRSTTRILNRVERLQKETAASFTQAKKPDDHSETDEDFSPLPEPIEEYKFPAKKPEFAKAVREAIGEDLPDLCFMLSPRIVFPVSMMAQVLTQEI